MSEWEHKLKHGSDLQDHGFRVGMRHLFNKGDWMARGEIETDSTLADLRQQNNHLHKGIQLCALYTPEADVTDQLVISYVERALNRQNNRVSVNDLRVAGTRVETVYGVEITRVLDPLSAFDGCILESRPMTSAVAASDTRRIARLLGEKAKLSSSVHPFIGLPTCHGISSMQLVLESPTKSESPYHTLRSLLAAHRPEPMYSLNSRLQASIDLARAVLILHSLGLVHKNIRPENILILGTGSAKDSSVQLGRPCLIGFGSMRSAVVKTQLNPEFYGTSQADIGVDKALHAFIYKHPKHWVRKRTDAYQMRDDIYALGVCLLEIAMWKSLFNWMSGIGSFTNDSNTLRLCRPRDFPNDRSKQLWKWTNQRLLVNLARTAIPAAMGETYRDVVVACLTCWEKSRLRGVISEEITKDAQAQDITKEAEQSISFFQEVVNKLESIKL